MHTSLPTHSSRISTAAIAVCLVMVGSLSLAGMLRHELWLDEAHHWLLARDSDSWSELVYHARYDGHPLLWNGFLFLISRFTANPFWMQVLNSLFAGLAVWVVLRHAPFAWPWKVLFAFGYFPLYEYGLLARNYALGMVLLFLACAIGQRRHPSYRLLGLLLALLANVHVLFLVLAIVLGGMMYFNNSRQEEGGLQTTFRVGMGLWLTGIVLSVLQIGLLNSHVHRLSADPGLNLQWAGKDALLLMQALLPVPRLGDGHFWNSNLLLSLPKPLVGLLAMGAWCLPWLLLQTRAFRLCFYGGALGVIGVLHLAQHSGVRYYGLVFLWLIACRWLELAAERKTSMSQLNQREQPPGERFRRFVWFGILSVQGVAGALAYGYDWNQPFSEGKAVVEYLRKHRLDDRLIAVDFSNAGPSVSTYLGKEVFYPQINAMGSFCIWPLVTPFISQDTLLARMGRQARQQEVILLLNRPLVDKGKPVSEQAIFPEAGIWVHTLAQFGHSIMRNENFYLYRIKQGSVRSEK